MNIFSRDQVIFLCQQPSFVLHSCKTMDKDVFFKSIDVIENLDYMQGRGVGGKCLQGNLWYSPPASMTLRLASVTFKMSSKVFIEETDKNLDFITEKPFRFLGFGVFKVSIVTEN